ncbi:MAG: RND family transporter, partial [Candidatus Ornithospirochaeta sp.]
MSRNKKISIAILVLVALFTAFFTYEATGLVVNGDFTRFFPWDEDGDEYYGGVEGQVGVLAEEGPEESDTFIYSSIYRTGATASTRPSLPEDGKDYPYTSTMYVLISSPDLWTAPFLSEVEACLERIEERRDSAKPTSVLDWMTFSGSDDHLGLISMNQNEDGVWSREDAEHLRENVENDPMVKYVLTGGSGNSILVQFIYADFASREQMDDISSSFQSLRDMGGRVVMMSNMVIALHVIETLSRDLVVLASLALLAVFLVYYFSFHSLRLAFATASVSLIAVIWTLGTMSIQGMDLNLMNVLTPCLVLVLGSTYSMHTISQYISNPNGDGFRSTRRILGTILLGAVTTIAGFVCLTLSPEEGIVSFGLSVSYGVVFCALLSTTYLPSLLTLIPPPRKKSVEKVKEGILNRAIAAVGRFAIDKWVLMLLLFVALIAGFWLLKDKISVNSNYMSYFPEGDAFGEDARLFATEMGGTTPFTVKMEAPEGAENFFLNMENLRKVKNWEDRVKENRHVLQIVSFPSYVAFANREITGEWDIPTDPGLGRIMESILLSYQRELKEVKNIVSEDFNTLTLTVQAWDGDKEDLSSIESTEEVYSLMVESLPLLPDGTKVTISGYPVISGKFSNRLMAGQEKSTLWAILAVFILSSIALLSPRRGLCTLVPVFSGIAVNYIFMYIA